MKLTDETRRLMFVSCRSCGVKSVWKQNEVRKHRAVCCQTFSITTSQKTASVWLAFPNIWRRRGDGPQPPSIRVPPAPRGSSRVSVFRALPLQRQQDCQPHVEAGPRPNMQTVKSSKWDNLSSEILQNLSFLALVSSHGSIFHRFSFICWFFNQHEGNTANWAVDPLKQQAQS